MFWKTGFGQKEPRIASLFDCRTIDEVFLSHRLNTRSHYGFQVKLGCILHLLILTSQDHIKYLPEEIGATT